MVRANRRTLLLLALLSLGGGVVAAEPPVNNRVVPFANLADTPARLTDLMASRQPYFTKKRSDTETLLVYVQKFPFVATPDEKVAFEKARARGEDPGPKTRILVIGVLKAPNAAKVLFRYWTADSHLLELYDATEYKGTGYLVCKLYAGKWGQKLVNQVPRTGYRKPLNDLASPWVPDTETQEVFRLNPEVKSHLRRDLPKR